MGLKEDLVKWELMGIYRELWANMVTKLDYRVYRNLNMGLNIGNMGLYRWFVGL